jgi:hypothetical protein
MANKHTADNQSAVQEIYQSEVIKGYDHTNHAFNLATLLNAPPLPFDIYNYIQ